MKLNLNFARLQRLRRVYALILLFLIEQMEDLKRQAIGKTCAQCGKRLLDYEQRFVRTTFGYTIFCSSCHDELNRFDTKVSFRRK